MQRVCVFPCHSHSPIPPTGTIVSPYPIKTIAKTGIQTCARVRVCLCVCMHACKRTHIPTYTDECTQIYQPIHTLGRERVISKSILLERMRGKRRMRAPKPPPVLADCKGLSVTAAFYWAKGKQQDSTWGPIKGYSSWKSALAHGLECTWVLIFRAVGAHSIFTACATPAGKAAHADAITHTTRLKLKLTQG